MNKHLFAKKIVASSTNSRKLFVVIRDNRNKLSGILPIIHRNNP